MYYSLFRRRSISTKRHSRARRVLRVAGWVCCSWLLLSVILTLPLRWVKPHTTSFVLQDGAASSRLLRQHWTRYEEISPDLKIAVVASEDQKFPAHFGFDLEALSDALGDSDGPRRGASTITMQLAKNLYLWSGRSVLRKGLEAWLTVLLEFFLPKERILELYLNVIEYGPGIYGVGHAAQAHFGKSASELGTGEAVLLAAVLPNPKHRSASSPSSYVRRRAAQIGGEVRRLGGPGYLGDL